MDKKTLEFLVWTFFAKQLVKPKSNFGGFNDLCSFAEDLGYKKIQETKEGIVYNDGKDELIIPFPEGYAHANPK